MGNANNTGYNGSEPIVKNRGLQSGLSSLNSVSLNKFSYKIPFRRAYSTPDLTTCVVIRFYASSLSTPTIDKPPVLPIESENPLDNREQVELKQLEIVRLAEIYGLYEAKGPSSPTPYGNILFFITHAPNLKAKKANSQTPGVVTDIKDPTDL